MARVDPKLLYPLKHRGEESQAHMPSSLGSDPRRHGEKMAFWGAENAKMREAVAVARKIAVLLLHRLWVSAEVYEPLRNTHRFGGQAAR